LNLTQETGCIEFAFKKIGKMAFDHMSFSLIQIVTKFTGKNAIFKTLIEVQLI